MQIENVGFYETRGGKLRYAVAKLPAGIGSDYQWIVCCPNNEFSGYKDHGCYYCDQQINQKDLIRYLPTVKSWDDPIPPPEPPAVTVYTEWLSVGPSDGTAWTGWTMDGSKPCYAVAKLRTVEVPANG